jgi:hypothetical protein
MRLTKLLQAEAVRRGLIEPGGAIDPAQAFYLVREMPYRRARDRRPETIIAEWRGTCSGKHYLLQQLFAELGLNARLIACTTTFPVDDEQVPLALKPLFLAANRRFVDVHNYLVLEMPGGQEMIVDATWPLSARKVGMITNPSFVMGQDQAIAADPIESFTIPADIDPQSFKNDLLRSRFSEAELAFREEVIRVLAERSG